MTDKHFLSAAHRFFDSVGTTGLDDMLIAMPAAPGTCFSFLTTTLYIGFSSVGFLSRLQEDATRRGMDLGVPVMGLNLANSQSAVGGSGNRALAAGVNWKFDASREEFYPKEFRTAEGNAFGVFTIAHRIRGTRLTVISATVEATPGRNGDYAERRQQIGYLLDVADQTASDHPTFIAADINQLGDDDGTDNIGEASRALRSRTFPLTLDAKCAAPAAVVANGGGQIIHLFYVKGESSPQLRPMGNYLDATAPSSPVPGQIILPGVAGNHPLVGVRMRFAACRSSRLSVCDGECVNRSTNWANCGSCGHQCGENEDCADGQCIAEPGPCPRGSRDCGVDCSGNQVCVPNGRRCPNFPCN